MQWQHSLWHRCICKLRSLLSDAHTLKPRQTFGNRSSMIYSSQLLKFSFALKLPKHERKLD
eukprot:2450627-Amphidinium_carterae.1